MQNLFFKKHQHGTMIEKETNLIKFNVQFVCLFHGLIRTPSTQHTHTHTGYHFVLLVRNNGSSVARCKFASSFARKKSEMKINRKRIQNSCAYFSLVGMFCVVLEHVFHSIADSIRILTNRWRILYITPTTQSKPSFHAQSKIRLCRFHSAFAGWKFQLHPF